jgi:actin-like ATPase involved in cell morphogenesis
MAYRLGVDLGTTWTAAAVADGSGVNPLALSRRDAVAIPSVVACQDDRLIAGDDAETVGVSDPASVAHEFKRRFGDDSPIVLGGKAFASTDLAGALLGHVVEVATVTHGAPPDALVLTHPAAWDDFRLDALRSIGAATGVGEVELVPEPIAAASHYVRLGRVAPGDTVGIYDLGGGTFDASVVRAKDSSPELLGPAEGLERFGSVDLDAALLNHVNEACDNKLAELDRSDPATLRALFAVRAACTKAKETLSADTDTVIPVNVPGLSTEVRVTRDELEGILRPRLAETFDCFDRVLADAGVSPDHLTGSLLVGGGSRVPLVGEALEAHTDRPAFLDADPKLVVAMGAAGGMPTAAELAGPADAGTPPQAPTGDAADAAEAIASGGGGGKTAAGALKASASTAATRAEQRRRMAIVGGSIAGVAAIAAAVGIAWHDHDFGPNLTPAQQLAKEQKQAEEKAQHAHEQAQHHRDQIAEQRAEHHLAEHPHTGTHEPVAAAPPGIGHVANQPVGLADAFEQVASRSAGVGGYAEPMQAATHGYAPTEMRGGFAEPPPIVGEALREPIPQTSPSFGADLAHAQAQTSSVEQREIAHLRNEVDQLAAAGRAEAASIAATDQALRDEITGHQGTAMTPPPRTDPTSPTDPSHNPTQPAGPTPPATSQLSGTDPATGTPSTTTPSHSGNPSSTGTAITPPDRSNPYESGSQTTPQTATPTAASPSSPTTQPTTIPHPEAEAGNVMAQHGAEARLGSEPTEYFAPSGVANPASAHANDPSLNVVSADAVSAATHLDEISRVRPTDVGVTPTATPPPLWQPLSEAAVQAEDTRVAAAQELRHVEATRLDPLGLNHPPAIQHNQPHAPIEQVPAIVDTDHRPSHDVLGQPPGWETEVGPGHLAPLYEPTPPLHEGPPTTTSAEPLGHPLAPPPSTPVAEPPHPGGSLPAPPEPQPEHVMEPGPVIYHPEDPSGPGTEHPGYQPPETPGYEHPGYQPDAPGSEHPGAGTTEPPGYYEETSHLEHPEA